MRRTSCCCRRRARRWSCRRRRRPRAARRTRLDPCSHGRPTCAGRCSSSSPPHRGCVPSRTRWCLRRPRSPAHPGRRDAPRANRSRPMRRGWRSRSCRAPPRERSRAAYGSERDAVGALSPDPDSTDGMGSSRPRARGTAFGSPSPLADLEDAQCRLGFVRHHLGAPRRTEHEFGTDLAEPLDRREERADLVLDQRPDRAAHRGEAVADVDVAVVLNVDLVDETEVDDVEPELRVIDLRERLPDLFFGHACFARLRWYIVLLGLDVLSHANSRRPSGICWVPAYANRRERTTWRLSARSSWTITRSPGRVCGPRSNFPTM